MGIRSIKKGRNKSSDHLATREIIYALYLALKYGYIDKAHTHIHVEVELKTLVSILTDYYKTVFSVLSRGND